MASSIRVKASSSGEITTVKALVRHPMDSGQVKDDEGNLIPAHYIKVITFEHEGDIVMKADWGPGVSKDPLIEFKFKGAGAGDELKIEWIDNKGQSDSTIAKIS